MGFCIGKNIKKNFGPQGFKVFLFTGYSIIPKQKSIVIANNYIIKSTIKLEYAL